MSSDKSGCVLIIESEPDILKMVSAALIEDGHKVVGSRNLDNALYHMSDEDFDAVIIDEKMYNANGYRLRDHLRNNHHELPVILMTVSGTVESAVNAMTSGAFHYFVKPLDYDKLRSVVARAVRQVHSVRNLETSQRTLFKHSDSQCRIIGRSQCMVSLLRMVEEIKNSESSVLITGETGTGKELIAKLLHYNSCRKAGPFVAVNCAAIPKNLIEAELFGYERGAFTGAHARRIGRFEDAAGGTILLDEVAELELSLQAKLLRVLQEREIERIGNNKKIKVDFRLVSSTNRNLKGQIKAGSFREDLFYRINVLHIELPPLRERKDDIPILAVEFLEEFCVREKKQVLISDEAMHMLRSYHWPGNIRQLKNIIERMVVLSKGEEITTRYLPKELQIHKKQTEDKGCLISLKQLEAQAIADALRQCKGNKSKASKSLGISRKMFYKRLKDLGIPDK